MATAAFIAAEQFWSSWSENKAPLSEFASDGVQKSNHYANLLLVFYSRRFDGKE
jgi:hypothetical protein